MSAPMTGEHVSRREFARRAGCNEKQVRRAVERGLLVVNAEGFLDVAQLDSGWRRPRRDTRESPSRPSVGDAAGAADKRADTGADKRASRKMSAPTKAGQRQASTGTPEANELRRAVARKEDYAGRLKELEYLQRAGKLIELDLAKQVVFDSSRQARNAWMNWPARYGAVIAADLGVDAGQVFNVLERYVMEQLHRLASPEQDADAAAREMSKAKP